MLYQGQDAIQEFQTRMRFLKNSRLYWCALIIEWTNVETAPWVSDGMLAAHIMHELQKSLATEEHKARLLVLPSGDIVVLGEAITNAAYRRMKLTMESLTAGMATGTELMCDAYDLSVDWDAFLEKCRDIYSRLGRLQQPARQFDKMALLKRLEGQMAAAGAMMKERLMKPAVLNLLFVEDEPTIRQLLNNLLATSGHSLSFAANSEDAVRAYIRKPPHIVFLDINLPDVSGLELLELIGKYDPKAHAVMLTSSGAQEKVKTAVQQGVKGYIVKPFSRQKLAECIDRYYGR
ncbi:MAG: response regulator [Sphingobacteriales bacterium]|nr:MAG: response regulator [Sphingobacteriales bacterium]